MFIANNEGYKDAFGIVKSMLRIRGVMQKARRLVVIVAE